MFADLYARLIGRYATSVALPLNELRRRWKSFSRRLRGREDPYHDADLPCASWKSCTSPCRPRIWESEFADGNATVAELAVVAAFAAGCEPGTHLFEIGTFDGRTTLNLALNAPAGCTISTLDLPPGRPTAFELADADRKYVEKPRSGARYEKYRPTHPEICDRIQQVYGDSATFDFSPYRATCSLVFVDGSHAYEYVRSDSEAAFEMVREGGAVLWHDYGEWQGVTSALNELARERGYRLRRIRGTTIVYWRKES